MNLYLLTQDVNMDWDTYDSAIVCAESEEEAAKVWNRRESIVPVCPECGYSDIKVVNTYEDDALVETFSQCLKCGTFIED